MRSHSTYGYGDPGYYYGYYGNDHSYGADRGPEMLPFSRKMEESLKTMWASAQNFVKHHGRGGSA
jgi:hypothetical protein